MKIRNWSGRTGHKRISEDKSRDAPFSACRCVPSFANNAFIRVDPRNPWLTTSAVHSKVDDDLAAVLPVLLVAERGHQVVEGEVAIDDRSQSDRIERAHHVLLLTVAPD